MPATPPPLTIQDLTVPRALSFSGGSVAVPRTPGLGAELDRDTLGALHEQWRSCGFREREDTARMRSAALALWSTRPADDSGSLRP